MRCPSTIERFPAPGMNGVGDGLGDVSLVALSLSLLMDARRAPQYLRSAGRLRLSTNDRIHYLGFRVGGTRVVL